MAIAERIERRAAQEAELGQHAKHIEHPWPQLALARLASDGVTLGQPGRGEVELQPVVALELRLELLAEFRLAVQPRHLVLVLVGEELEVVAGDGLGQRQVIGAIGLTHPLDQLAIAARQPGTLVAGEEIHAPVDDLFQGLADRTGQARLGHFGRARQPFHGLALEHGTAAPAEGLQIQLGRHAVELDGLLDGLGADRQQPLLIGEAEKEQVGGDAVAQQPRGEAGGVDEVGLLGTDRIADGLAHGSAGHLGIGVAGELGGGGLVTVHHGIADLLVEAGQRFIARRDDQVAAEQQVSFTGGNAHGVDVALLGGDAHVGGHRAELLRQTGLVEHRAALAFQMRGHAEQRAKGGHTAAADTRNQHVPWTIQRWVLRLGQCRRLDTAGYGFGLAQPAAMHGDETRAEALDAGEILVAGVLVDLALAAQFGFQRQHRQAVGLLTAVAATLAHRRVDEGALGRVFQLAALASTTFLGGTGLIIDDHRDALEFSQLALHRIQFAAVVEAGDRREAIAGRVLVRLVADQGDALDALVEDLPAELIDAQLAVDGLAARHGHGIVVENLVGHVHAGRDGRTHGQAAGVEIGAVAQILEHVRGVGERRLADPVDALAAHLGKGLGAPVHPLHHVVTANTGRGAAALGHLGRAVVRATGAVVRRAHSVVATRSQGFFLGGEEGQARLDAVAGIDWREALGDDPGDHRRGQLGEVRQQRIALLVELADHPRTLADRPVVKLPGELVLDDAALFLDHQNLVQPLGELVHRDRLQRPAHADLEHPQADRGAQRFVQAEVVQRLAHVEIGLAGGDDAHARIRRIKHHPVEVVGPCEGTGGIDLVQVEAFFLSQRRVRPADMHAVLGQFEVVRDTRLHTQRIDFHHGGGVDVLGNGLQRHPAAGVARQFPADDAVIENFLNVGGVQHRNRGGDEGMLALVRQRRGLAAVVVTRQQQHAAVGCNTCRIAVLEHVAGAVDPRALAVPHGEHAVVLGAGEQVGLLAAPHRGGG